MRSADRHFRPHRKLDSTQLTLYSMINSTNHSSSTPAVLKRTRVSGSVGVQNKTELRFPTARKGIGHVKLGRKRRRRRGSRKRRRSRGRRMVSVCSDTFVDGPSVTVHNERGSVSDHSGADLGSGADPGPARVPGHQRGRSPGGECSAPVCLPDSSGPESRQLLIGFLKRSIRYWRVVAGPAHRLLTCGSVCR